MEPLKPHAAGSPAAAAARRVRARRQDVVLERVVQGPGLAAVGRARARGADRVHHALHGVAPLVAAGHGDAAQVALAGVPELVGAWRAQHMAPGALYVQRETCGSWCTWKMKESTAAECVPGRWVASAGGSRHRTRGHPRPPPSDQGPTTTTTPLSPTV